MTVRCGPSSPRAFYETQLIAFVLSADGQNDPDVLAINGASVALTCSMIPFYSPVGAVRVGRIDGQYILNPTNAERDKSEIDLIVAGTEEAVVMVEAGAHEVPADHRRDPLRARSDPADRGRPEGAPAKGRGGQAPLAGRGGLSGGGDGRGPARSGRSRCSPH